MVIAMTTALSKLAALAALALLGTPGPVRGALLLPFEDLPLAVAGIVVAHDAGTTYLHESEVVGVEQVVAFTKTQPDGGFSKLLECGARGLDVRPKVDRKGRLVLHHGIVALPVALHDALEEVKAWSARQPRDPVLLYFSHIDGKNATARTREAVKAAKITVVEDCRSLGTMAVSEAAARGPVLAFFGCVQDNYDPSVTCEEPGLLAQEPSEEEEEIVGKPFAKYLCFDDATKAIPIAHLKSYMRRVSAQGRPRSGLSMSQGHWQYVPSAVALGTLYGSSTLEDTARSGINHVIAQELRNNTFDYVNLLELDNVCDGGASVREALLARTKSRTPAPWRTPLQRQRLSQT